MSRRSLGIWDFAAAVFDDDQQKRAGGGSPGPHLCEDDDDADREYPGRPRWATASSVPEKEGIARRKGHMTAVDRLLQRMQVEATRAAAGPNAEFLSDSDDDSDYESGQAALTPVKSLQAARINGPAAAPIPISRPGGYAKPTTASKRGGKSPPPMKRSGNRNRRSGSRLGLPYNPRVDPAEVAERRGPAWLAHRAALASSGGTAGGFLHAAGRRLELKAATAAGLDPGSLERQQLLEASDLTERLAGSDATETARNALLEDDTSGWGTLWMPDPEEGYIGSGVAKMLEEEAEAGRALPWTRLDREIPTKRRSFGGHGGRRSLGGRPTSVADDVLASRKPLYNQPLRRPRTQGSPGRVKHARNFA